MYEILGEKSTRIVQNETSNRFVILDKSSNDFILEKIQNCRIFDAYAILKCRKKVQKKSEWSFIIPPKDFFKKQDFYIQTSIINKQERFKNVILVEHIISEFCKTITDAWWIYVAEHISSGIEIVSGVGSGIIVSRILPQDSDIERNIFRTIQYIKRFGYESGIKIISLTPKFKGEINIETDDAELFLMNFASKNTQIPVFGGVNNPFYLYFIRNTKNIFIGMIFFFCIFVITLATFEYKIFEDEKFIKSDSKFLSVTDLSKNFHAKLTERNLGYVKAITNEFKKIKNPINSFQKLQEIFQGINLEAIQIKNSGINIKCDLTEAQKEKLLSNKSIEISFQNQNLKGAELCVKFK